MEFLFSGAINYLAVAAVTAGAFILNILWFGLLFRKHVMPQTAPAGGMAPAPVKEKHSIFSYIFSLLGAALTTIMIAIFVNYTDVTTAQGGAMTGFYLWLLLVPVQLSPVLWEKRHFTSFLVKTTFSLICFVGSGIVLTLWGLAFFAAK